MLVREIFEQLEHGELRSMALGGSNASGILPSDYPKLIAYMNLALAELYKRFPMRTRTVTIQQLENISEYVLDPAHAYTNTASTAPKYIMDSSFQPFDDGSEVLKIEAVYDEKGEKYFLNDHNQPYSLFTPRHNSIQVPYADENNAMSVQYRCGHKKLIGTGDAEAVLNQEVTITATYLQPLLYFIAARFYQGQGNQEAMMEGNNYLAQYELALHNIRNENLSVMDDTSNRRLEQNGWV